MANSKSARKRAHTSENRRRHNMAMRSKMRTYIKKVVSAISGGDREAAVVNYREAVPVIDSMVNKGILHKNKAARHKSRLSQHIKGMTA